MGPVSLFPCQPLSIIHNHSPENNLEAETAKGAPCPSPLLLSSPQHKIQYSWLPDVFRVKDSVRAHHSTLGALPSLFLGHPAFSRPNRNRHPLGRIRLLPVVEGYDHHDDKFRRPSPRSRRESPSP